MEPREGAGSDDVADIFADLNLDGAEVGAGPSSRRATAGGAGRSGAPENDALEDSFDGGSGNQRASGVKNNADDNPFSFTKFLQGKGKFFVSFFVIFFLVYFFLDATTHLYKRSCPSSVGPSVPCYFQTTNMTIFEGRKKERKKERMKE